MNILYINHYAGGLKYGMEFRPFYLAREWVKRGHRVRIIAADFSHLRTINPTVKKDFEIENVEGIEYQWIKAGTYKGNGIKRALSMFRFVGKLWHNAEQIANDFNPDVVISSSTYPLDTYAAQRIKQFAMCNEKNKVKCKYIHEGHDLWPLTLIEVGGMNKRNPFCIIMGMAERLAYKNADAIVSVLPNTLSYMVEQGLNDTTKFNYIPNGIVKEDWYEPVPLAGEAADCLEALHKAGKFIVLYLGGHAVSNALDTYVEAAAKIKNDKNVAFVMIGKGVEKERLMKKAKKLHADNLYFLPPVSKKMVPSVLKVADALYVGAKPCSIYRYGVSMNKLYDYMMAGRPVISGVEASNDDVAAAGCGFTVRPEASEAIITAVRKLQEMSIAERKAMGQKGREWVLKNTEYANLSEKFLQIMEE